MKYLAPILAACLLVSGDVRAMAADANSANNAVAATDGMIVAIDGKAWVKTREGKADARVGTYIYPGDQIETEAHSHVSVRLGRHGEKDAAIRLNPNSEVSIKLVDVKDWEIELKHGGVLSTVKNPEKRPHHFSLRTRTAVMGVRGTTFFVKSEPGHDDFVCTCHGTVNISGTDITSEHHDAPKTLKSAEGSLELVAAPMGDDHSDADGAALAKWLE